MADERVSAPETLPQPVVDIHDAIFLRPRPRKPKRQETDRRSPKEILDEALAQDESCRDDAVQALVEAARGVQCILSAQQNDDLPCSTAWSLAEVLSVAIERADFRYFGSLGDLNTSIHPEHFVLLLRRELKEARTAARRAAAARHHL